jgi:hypothetical protein
VEGTVFYVGGQRDCLGGANPNGALARPNRNPPFPDAFPPSVK